MPRKVAVAYDLRIEPEDISFEGNCSAIDPETDRNQEEWIRRELASGNDLAWCWAQVTAKVDGFEGSDSLGGISCRDREEFDRVFLPEMRRNALADLRRQLSDLASGKVERETVREIRKRARAARAVLAALPGGRAS